MNVGIFEAPVSLCLIALLFAPCLCAFGKRGQPLSECMNLGKALIPSTDAATCPLCWAYLYKI